MHEWVGRTWHLNSLGTSWDAKNILKIFFYFAHFTHEYYNITKFCQNWIKNKKFLPIFSRYFLHLMRYLNFWDNKIFWGAKFGPLTHASSVKSYNTKYNYIVHFYLPPNYLYLVAWLQQKMAPCTYDQKIVSPPID